MIRKLFAGAICAVLFAGCGGGGGGGGSSPAIPNSPSAAAPTPAPTPGAITQQSVQRQDTNQALSAANGAQKIYAYTAPGSPSALTIRRAALSVAPRLVQGYARGERSSATARRSESVTLGPCTNGTRSTIVNVSNSESQLYLNSFYDAGCTLLYQDVYFDLVAQSTTSFGGAGTVTSYTRTGSVFSYDSLTLSVTGVGSGSGTVSVVDTVSPSSTLPALMHVGITCAITAGASSEGLGCGFALAAKETALNSDVGAIESFSSNIPTGSTSSTVTVPISGNLTAYTGPLSALTLSQTGASPYFTIGGGSLAGSVNYSGSLAFTNTGLLTAGTITVNDPANGASVTVTSNGSTTSGQVMRTDNGQSVAAFTVDVNGNGTVTYGNGATGTIANWVVVG